MAFLNFSTANPLNLPKLHQSSGNHVQIIIAIFFSYYSQGCNHTTASGL